jgi:hypothetical protein
MKLYINLHEPVNGYWDGGKKQYFCFDVQKYTYSRDDGKIKVGSWEANYWVLVKASKHKRKILQNALQALKATIKIPFTWEVR